MKEALVGIVGVICASVALYFLAEVLPATYSLFVDDYDQSDAWRLGLILVVGYAIAILFAVPGFFTIRWSLRAIGYCKSPKK